MLLKVIICTLYYDGGVFSVSYCYCFIVMVFNGHNGNDCRDDADTVMMLC